MVCTPKVGILRQSNHVAVYPVQLDTGSSDLFVHGDTSPLPGTRATVGLTTEAVFIGVDLMAGLELQSYCE